MGRHFYFDGGKATGVSLQCCLAFEEFLVKIRLNLKFLFPSACCYLFSSFSTLAMPIDWHGVLGFDTTSIDNYRRIEKEVDDSQSGNANGRGTQEVPLGAGNHTNANWQSALFRLEPTLIINDAATIGGEFSLGYARGRFLGDNNSQTLERGFGDALYPYQFSSGGETLALDKLFVELYSDVATYVLGRHSAHYGLGAVVNSGEGSWDRFSFTRDGISAKVKIGGIGIEAFWSRQGRENSLSKATRTREMGVAVVYQNVERDLSFGLLHSVKQSAPFALDYDLTGDIPIPGSSGSVDGEQAFASVGQTDTKLIDLFFRKKFGPLQLGVEIPIMSGHIGTLLNPDNPTVSSVHYKAKAIIFESDLELNEQFKLGLDGGSVSGGDGSGTHFSAMYLNPNYQIANLLFRYNLRAIGNPDRPYPRSVYDSYIHNATYLKLGLTYETGSWIWDAALIWARANEVANAGEFAYNHSTSKRFEANYGQSKNLGQEFDVNFRYLWNSEISVGGAFGLLFTGDYFAYTNSDTPNSVSNSFVAQLNTAITF